MKKSNIIIIAFGLFLVGGMLTLYVDSKYHNYEKDQEMTKNKEILLPLFSVIVAEKGSDLHIEQSDTNKLSIEYFPDKKIPSKLYAVSGDTLHVYMGLRMFVKCRNLNTVIGKKHKWVGINDFMTDALNIRMSGGEMYYNNEILVNKNYKDKIEPKLIDITIIGKDSAQINLQNMMIGNLNIKSDSSTMNIYGQIRIINADLSHQSNLRILSNYDLIKVTRDHTSHISIEQ